MPGKTKVEVEGRRATEALVDPSEQPRKNRGGITSQEGERQEAV